jgi:hypothetical protein
MTGAVGGAIVDELLNQLVDDLRSGHGFPPRVHAVGSLYKTKARDG